MTISPELKREMNNMIKHALQRILAEGSVRLDRFDILCLKHYGVDFDPNMRPDARHPTGR